MAEERSFEKLRALATDLDQAWQDRLHDAESLLAAGRHASAIASGLYALEIYLKYRICKKLELSRLPRPFEIHALEGLLIVAGLRSHLSNESQVKQNWVKIKDLAGKMNDLRYKPDHNFTRREAEDFFVQLRDPSSGVLTWLQTQV